MDLKLTGKTALVSGASSIGIARSVAIDLATEGVRVAITARRTEELHKLADEIEGSGCLRPFVLPADMYDPGTPAYLAAEALSHLGRIDILVNAAGGSRPISHDAPEEKWEEGMTLNFTRLRQLSHAVLPGMIANHWGRIISLTATSEPLHLNVAHAAKAAVTMWSKGLSRELGPHGITVNCVVPGLTHTEQIRKAFPTPEAEEKQAQTMTLRRFGEPEELSSVITFLASPRASFITGAAIFVDGGQRRFAY